MNIYLKPRTRELKEPIVTTTVLIKTHFLIFSESFLGHLKGIKIMSGSSFQLSPLESRPSATMREQMSSPFAFKLNLGFNSKKTV